MKRITSPDTRKIGGLSVCLLALLAAGGCSSDSTAQQSPQGHGGPPTVNVVGFKSLRSDLSDKISIIGSLESNESVELRSEISGTIERIKFDEGQRIKAGELLFQIDMEKLKATYDQAQANLKLAETTAHRYQNLVQSKAVSQQEYDQTVATLESNRATVALTREQLSDATITAPFDGVMGERLVSEGQFVGQGTPLGSLYSQDPMKVTFNVPERYVGAIREGQGIALRVAAYKDKNYEGKVYFISPNIDRTTRTVLVKARVPNPQGQLRSGMFANLELIFEVKKDAILIPETALIIKGDSVSVYTVGDDDTVALRPINVGTRRDGMVEILSGLQAEEVVVTEGYQKIGPGSKVSVRLEDPTEKKFYEII
ncbi:MAG: efflux RND transporter periplasmic adaptor subunit [Candidatus Omnitrophica bacterium]|nr:efflux RND transporter periplasmic adaptor subunit [Candidatus Omnitrophota bacterium]